MTKRAGNKTLSTWRKIVLCTLAFLLVGGTYALGNLSNLFFGFGIRCCNADELKGPVKSIVTSSAGFVQRFGEWQEESPHIGGIERYDESGNRIGYTRYNFGENYNFDETLKDRAEFKYDENGNQIEAAYYDANGILGTTAKFKYDENGNQIEAAYYDANGILGSIDKFKYDENGNQIEEVRYNANGTLEFELKAQYDGNGNLIEVLVGGSRYGNPPYKYRFQYDENGNPIEEYEPSDESLSKSKYDEHGNLIEEARYNADGSLRSRSEHRYDEKGNEIEIAVYDASGTLLSHWLTSYEYDEFGNWTKATHFEVVFKFGEFQQEPRQVLIREITYY